MWKVILLLLLFPKFFQERIFENIKKLKEKIDWKKLWIVKVKRARWKDNIPPKLIQYHMFGLSLTIFYTIHVDSGWSCLDHVGEPWLWWAKLYWEPSKKNLRLEKNVFREGILSRLCVYMHVWHVCFLLILPVRLWCLFFMYWKATNLCFLCRE